ncbi:hypothetical protein E4U41_002712 [Claviceps citrina]|nr:hypothetical protein E4U41_002712 [Claviceps citrina]
MRPPKNWPPTLPYLPSPLHDKLLSPTHLHALHAKPSPSSSSSSSSSSHPPSTPTIPPSATRPIPSPNVRIQPIRNPSHPAHGQHGLFAARHLPPGDLILVYSGRVHSSAGTDPTSDYDLWIDREADLAVDAGAQGGNEARFVNDYRGVADRPNAVFGTAWCEAWGQLCVAVWVAGGKGKGAGIRKGDEILVSYGKGFWGERRAGGDGS